MTNNLSNKTRSKRLIIGAIGFILLVLIDQFTKYLATTLLKGEQSFVIIKGVFELYYLENRGAAFGMLQGQKWLFVILVPILLIIITCIYYRIPDNKRYRWLEIICVLLGAGAIGNLIDRIRLDYVVDFLYFSLIDFPVFNIADCYVVVSAIAIILLVLFYYKEEELDFLFFKKKKRTDDATIDKRDDGTDGRN